MKKSLVLIFCTAVLATGCTTANNDQSTSNSDNPAIAQAEMDLMQAKKMKAEWRMLDKAIGKTAQDLSKALKKAKEIQAAGNVAEATRLAEKISDYARMGIAQAEQQKNAKPSF